MENNLKLKSIYDIVYIGLGAAFIAICSWIAIPLTTTPVPVTLQTFAVFAIAGILGLKRGTLAVLVYILLGAIGLPVFAGFTSGLGVVLGNTGGYIIGFLFSAAIVGLAKKLFGNKNYIIGISMVVGLLICYLFGTFWFMQVYAQKSGTISFFTAFSWCVVPFIIPDIVKIVLAIDIVDRVSKYVKH